jgi:hypothetical protein
MSEESERLAELVDRLPTDQRRDILERVEYEILTTAPSPGADWPGSEVILQAAA